MIIVRLMGGLGNQMFQYAAGRRTAEVHRTEVKFDLSLLLDRSNPNVVPRNFDLDIFNFEARFAEPDEIMRVAPLTKRQHRLHRRLPFFFRYPRFVVEPPRYFPEFFELTDGVLLQGYWQDDRYFKDIEPILRREFTFRTPLDDRCRRLADEIAGSNSVCVNVRRGDFVTSSHHGVCGTAYFNEAIRLVAERVENPRVFIFSDDVEWCASNLSLGVPQKLVSHEYAGNKFGFYLQLMMLCRHFIIPNSSFGWWAAWLAENPDKIIIAPRRWFADPSINTDDLVPKSWIRI